MANDDSAPRMGGHGRIRWPRGDRELFFWTARQMLGLVFLAALTVYSIVQMAEGHLVLVDHLLRAFELLSGGGRAP